MWLLVIIHALSTQLNSEAEQVKLSEDSKMNECNEATIVSQVSLTSEQEELIREQAMQLPTCSSQVSLQQLQ